MEVRSGAQLTFIPCSMVDARTGSALCLDSLKHSDFSRLDTSLFINQPKHEAPCPARLFKGFKGGHCASNKAHHVTLICV